MVRAVYCMQFGKITAVRIPSGSVLELVQTAVAGFAEVQWNGDVHMIPLNTLLRGSSEVQDVHTPHPE